MNLAGRLGNNLISFDFVTTHYRLTITIQNMISCIVSMSSTSPTISYWDNFENILLKFVWIFRVTRKILYKSIKTSNNFPIYWFQINISSYQFIINNTVNIMPNMLDSAIEDVWNLRPIRGTAGSRARRVGLQWTCGRRLLALSPNQW